MKILWVSKHKPLDSQIEELRRLFGDETTITVDSKPFSDDGDIYYRFIRGGYDEIILIAPLSTCRKLMKRGIKPLYPEMTGCPQVDAEVTTRTAGTVRHFKFKYFKRMESMEVRYSKLTSTLDKA